MAFYDFTCSSCPKAPLIPNTRKRADAEFVEQFSMSKAPKLDSKIMCPVCKRISAKRVVSSGVAAIIKGQTQYDWKHGEGMRTNINGQDVRFTFVDHPHTDPAYQAGLARQAKAMGIQGRALSKARRDEKSGKLVVDVASNVKDPLGMMQRAKKAGNVDTASRKINTPYKRRPKRR